MSTTLRIDNSELISGALVIGDTGGGVLGSTIPSSGGTGPGYTYNDLSLPSDANKEIMGRILTLPSAGTLTTYEDTSFVFTGAPDGSYTFTYQLYVDYVPVGSPATVTLNVGTSTYGASLVCTTTLSGGLTTQIKLVAAASATSSLTADLTTSVPLNANLFTVSSVSASLSTGSNGLQANLSGSATIVADLSTEISLAAALTAISNVSATLAGSGSIKPGDKLTITYLGNPFTITLN